MPRATHNEYYGIDSWLIYFHPASSRYNKLANCHVDVDQAGAPEAQAICWETRLAVPQYYNSTNLTQARVTYCFPTLTYGPKIPIPKLHLMGSFLTLISKSL